MKSVKIVIWLVIAVLLTSVLIFALVVQNNDTSWFSFGSNKFSGSYNSKDYEIGSPTESLSNIEEVKINWIAGEINISQSTDGTVSFNCPEDKDLEEDFRLRYLVKDGKLTIQFTKPFNVFQQLLKGNRIKKTLNISLPKDISEVNVDNVSSDINITNTDIDTLRIDNVSGHITIEGESTNCSDIGAISIDSVSGTIAINSIISSDFFVDTVSGDVTASNITSRLFKIGSVSGVVKADGSFEKVDVETVSGKVDINSITMIRNLEAESVSADINIAIPENDGFSVRVDTVSGKLTSDFDIPKQGTHYRYKNGDQYDPSFEIETISGDVTINRV